MALGIGAGGRKVAQSLRALGELDEHDADVFHHRQQHLAQTLHLLRGLLFVFDSRATHFAEMAQTIHVRDARNQAGDVSAETRRQHLAPLLQMIRHSVQGGRRDGLVIHVQADEDGSRTQCMFQQGCACDIYLIVIQRCRKLAGFADECDFIWYEDVVQRQQPALDVGAGLTEQGWEGMLDGGHGFAKGLASSFVFLLVFPHPNPSPTGRETEGEGDFWSAAV